MSESTFSTTSNVDPHEIDKFAALADRWWRRDGEFRPLHDINPLRVRFITEGCGSLSGRRILDVGCGGGILSEAMAHQSAHVTGIDLGEATIGAAKAHAEGQPLALDYRVVSVEALAEEAPGQFDVVTCMEMLEHVPDPESIVAACARLVKPDGHLFFSTLNRHPKAWLFGIVAAERVLKLLPAGTHDYHRFIRPAELARWARQHHLEVQGFKGLSYQPFTRQYSLGDDLSINYMMHCRPSID
ncbi:MULTISPECIES: bifunctional 2-polyprenyl-6-hydroxyphenol methylase/3-demethylubiquinol 3-O-methyltransferase UbiG [unclassified Zymobacter]|uniref:bifunctional 2-polyprenyl-6-hydroxyphenol methylase/3-demethylubiquinol 3-O-methyltransferase UbiG n=1 Tax=unclassified Zymobacter TaxID=3048685 RepID=UPI0039C241EC